MSVVYKLSVYSLGQGGGVQALEGMGAQRQNASIEFKSKPGIIISECGL